MSSTTVWTDEHFIGGDHVLDFANTVYRRTPELGADLLNNSQALITWLDRARLLPPDQPLEDLPDPGAALAEARALRELFWATFDAQTAGRELPAGALAGLLDIARRAIGDIAVHPDGSATPLTIPGGLGVLALRGLTLALSPPDRPVRACDRCGWFFTDVSRGRRRRWCSMKTCGNQAKVARYRATHA